MIVREPLSFLASQDHSVVSSHDSGVHCALCIGQCATTCLVSVVVISVFV